jgi:hypothetical protein
MFKISNKLKLLLLSFVLTLQVFAQRNPKWSADLSLGIPTTFFSVNSDLTGIYQGAVRYSFNKNWSVSGRVSSKVFFGKTNNPSGIVSPDGVYAKDLVSYRNAFYDIGGYVHYNFGELFGWNKPTSKFSPFATFGAGLQFWKLKSVLIDGRSSAMSEFGTKPMRNYQLGLGVRYYLNPSFDLLLSSEYNYVESYWMDGAYGDKKLDTYLNTSLGVTYKFGADLSKNLVDWEFKNVKEDNTPPKNYARWSADLNVGLPIMLSKIGYSPTLMAGIAGRYSISNFFSLQANYHIGQFSGSQDLTSNALGGRSDASFIKEYTNTMNQFTLRALFNLRRLSSEPENLNSWNYYAVIGGGYLFYSVDNTFADNSKYELVYNKGTQNLVVGAQARKHINSTWDFVTGVDFNYNESKWLDGAGNEPNQNHHFYVNAGVSYKFATAKNRELIDWSYSNYNFDKNPKEVDVDKIPVIDKPKVEDAPKVAQPTEPAVTAPPVVIPPAKEEPKLEPVTTPVTKPVEPVKPTEPVVVPAKPKAEPVVPKTAPAKPKVVAPAKPRKTPAKPKVDTSNVSNPVVVTPTEQSNTEDNFENKETVTEPEGEYNVVVGCYGLGRLDLAMKYRDTIRKQGFKANVYRSLGSKYYRVMTTSTDDKQSALRILKRSKVEIDSQSWFYLYNKQ